MRVEEAMGLGGADENDDGVIEAEILADSMVLLDFGGIFWDQCVTVSPKLEA